MYSIVKFTKYFFYLILILFIGYFIYFINTQDPYKKRLRKDLKEIIKNGSIVKHLYNDYRELFLPETQFINLSFKEIELNFLNLNQCYFGKCHTFFLDQYKDELIIADRNTEIRSIKFNDILNDKLNFKKINKNKIYVSGKKKLIKKHTSKY